MRHILLMLSLIFVAAPAFATIDCAQAGDPGPMLGYNDATITGLLDKRNAHEALTANERQEWRAYSRDEAEWAKLIRASSPVCAFGHESDAGPDCNSLSAKERLMAPYVEKNNKFDMRYCQSPAKRKMFAKRIEQLEQKWGYE